MGIAKKLFWSAVLIICLILLLVITLTHEAAGEFWSRFLGAIIFFALLYGVGDALGATWTWLKKRREKGGLND